MADKKKFNEITLLKMLALLSVLFFHCYRPFFGSGSYWKVVIDGNLDYLSWLLHFNKLFDVHCLFFCSGFLFFMTRAAGNRSVKDQLVKRVKRIVVPYFQVGLLYLIPLYTIFSIPSGLHLASDSLLEGYEKFCTMMFSEHLWFLQILLIINVICLLTHFAAKRWFWLLLTGSFLLTLLFNWALKGVYFMSLQSLSDNLFIFVLGGGIYRICSQLTPGKNLALMAGSLALFLTAYNIPVEKGQISALLSQIAAGGACVSAFCFARLFADRVMDYIGKFRAVQFYDRNFMAFYLYHMPLPLIAAMYLYEPFTGIIKSDLAYVFFAWGLTLGVTALAVKADLLIRKGTGRIVAKLKGPEASQNQN